MRSYLDHIDRSKLNCVDTRLFDFLKENENQISCVWFEFLFHLLKNNDSVSSSTYSAFVLLCEIQKNKILGLISKNFYVDPFHFCEFLGIKKDLEVLKYFLSDEPVAASVKHGL